VTGCPGGVLPAAASTEVAALLAAPSRPARVLAAWPRAVYLDVDGELLAVLAPGAVRLPFALTLAEPLPAPTARPGPARVGAGRVVIGGWQLRVGRWWRPPRPRPPRPGGARWPGAGPDAADHLPPVVAARVRRLGEALTAGDKPGCTSAADRLLGLGPGLTPSGDDVLAGLFLAAALQPYPLDALGAHVTARAGTATTALSAALLRCAVRGVGCPEAVAFVDAVGGHADVPAAYRRLARIGHTSGRDLAAGVQLAARLALDISRRSA
jgi:hypothetical protein